VTLKWCEIFLINVIAALAFNLENETDDMDAFESDEEKAEEDSKDDGESVCSDASNDMDFEERRQLESKRE